MNLRLTISALLAFSFFGATSASSQAPQATGPIRIGVLTDMSGVFSDISGKGAVVAVEMAAEDFGGKALGRPIEVISADHQNKADIAASIARKWIDVDGVTMFQDLMNSAVAISVSTIAAEKDRIAIVNGAATSSLTNDRCNANTIHYTWDTYALPKAMSEALVKRGDNTWFYITVDYAFGRSLADDSMRFVKDKGGKVLGEVRHPLNTADFASFLLQAQSSGAKVIGLGNAGSDFINAVKQANQFGIVAGGQSLAALSLSLSDVPSLGLDTAQGILFTATWYWDTNDETRAFAKRFKAKFGKMPTEIQAGNYSSTMHYLEAIKAAGTTDAKTVMAKMKEIPVNDFFATNGYIRQDGRFIHDVYLAQIKTPAESKYDWDYFKLLEKIPGEQAFRPVSESACSLLKK